MEMTRTKAGKDQTRVAPTGEDDYLNFLLERGILHVSSVPASYVAKGWCIQGYMSLISPNITSRPLQKADEYFRIALEDFELSKAGNNFKHIIGCSRMVLSIGFVLLSYTFLFVSEHGSFISIGILPLLILLIIMIDEMANMAFDAPTERWRCASAIRSLADDMLENNSMLVRGQKQLNAIDLRLQTINTGADRRKGIQTGRQDSETRAMSGGKGGAGGL
eukprot:517941-Hanusia_phi.AAC.1